MKKLTTRRFLLAVFLAAPCLLATGATGDFETATEAVKNMKLGWNLGNSLESNSGDTLNMWIEHWTQRQPSDYETAWGQPVTRPELVRMFRQAGFNAIRVPVTWYPHMEAKFNFTTWQNSYWYPYADDLGTQVDAAWMARVKEVVDYVINEGMYCILNIHHDTGAENTAWLLADMNTYTKQRERFEAVWTQIAEQFRDYDDHLLFEGYNEMLDPLRSWCFASFASSNKYDAQVANSAYQAINSYAQSFVNAVRATGGNNAQRNLIVSTYGACSGGGTWNQHLKDPLKQMQLPSDITQGHLIFEIHTYPDVSNLQQAKNEVDDMVNAWNTHLKSKGAPVIVGEWGASDGNAYQNNRSNLLAFARYFVERTKAADICPFYWMGLSDKEDRTVPKFTQPDLVDAIVKGCYGEGGYTGIAAPGRQSDRVDVYSLNGIRLLSRMPRNGALDALPKGIYLVDGEKVVKK